MRLCETCREPLAYREGTTYVLTRHRGVTDPEEAVVQQDFCGSCDPMYFHNTGDSRAPFLPLSPFASPPASGPQLERFKDALQGAAEAEDAASRLKELYKAFVKLPDDQKTDLRTLWQERK